MGKARTPAVSQFQFKSPFGELRYDPEVGSASFGDGGALADSSLDESLRRNLLRQLLPQLGVTAPQRESIRGRFEQAFYDRLRERIQEDFTSTQSKALEQLGARNLLGSSLEARRLGDLESARSQSVTDAAQRAIIESEELSRQDEETKLALLRALEQGIANEFTRRLEAARLTGSLGLQGAGLSQRAKESAERMSFNTMQEQFRSGLDLIRLLNSLSMRGDLSGELLSVLGPLV